MKIFTGVLAAACIVWVCFASLVSFTHPPLFDFWSAGAITNADEIIARSGTNILDGTPLTVSRGTLMMLTLRAKAPDNSQRSVQIFRWISVGFALIAGMSLFLLSRRNTIEKDSSA
jgi:hypothetical protein